MAKIRRKKKLTFQINNKRFDTFGKMKTWAYFNLYKDEIITGFALSEEDEIIKEYQFKKTERRLLCELKYDQESEELKKYKINQLSLWQ